MHLEGLTIQEILQAATQAVKDSPAISQLDVELLLAHVLGKSRAYLRAYSEIIPTKAESQSFQSLLSRRQAGEPAAYLLGQKEFWSMAFKVTPAVLIPRPETEVLVTYVLEHFGVLPDCRVLDLGTGSGAIACAVAGEKPGWCIEAVDESEAAVSVARENAELNQLSNIEFKTSNWFENVQGHFDLILSNPPYIEKNDPHLQLDGVKHEPLAALVAEEQGYADLFHLIRTAKTFLKPEGCLILEHGFEQAGKIRQEFDANGYHSIKTLPDLNQLDRITLGYLCE